MNFENKIDNSVQNYIATCLWEVERRNILIPTRAYIMESLNAYDWYDFETLIRQKIREYEFER
jgi:hypothetical protein